MNIWKKPGSRGSEGVREVFHGRSVIGPQLDHPDVQQNSDRSDLKGV